MTATAPTGNTSPGPLQISPIDWMQHIQARLVSERYPGPLWPSRPQTWLIIAKSARDQPWQIWRGFQLRRPMVSVKGYWSSFISKEHIWPQMLWKTVATRRYRKRHLIVVTPFSSLEKNASSPAWVTVPLGPRAIAAIVMKTQTHLAFLEAKISSKHVSPTFLHHRKNMAWQWQ